MILSKVTSLAFLLFAFLIISGGFQSFSQAQEKRLYLVPTETLDLLQFQSRPTVYGSQAGLSVVALSVDQVQQVSAVVHRHYGTCGGFTDVQMFADKYGMDAQAILRWGVSRPKNIQKFDLEVPRYPAAVQQLLSKLNGQRYAAYLKELTDFPDRYSRGDLGAKAAHFLFDRAKTLAQKYGRPEIAVAFVATGGTYKQDSVIVRVPGKQANLPAAVVGGHMDTFQNNKPGADDDGSGSATVEELYTAVLESGLRFERDIYFIFYAAEEMGLVGSQRVVQEFSAHKIAVRGVLQLDMTGYKSQKDQSEIYLISDHVDTNLTAFLKKLVDTYVKVPVSLTRCGYACSDHASWTDAGYSSSFPFESTLANDNKTIHTERDRIELINWEHTKHFTQLGASFVVEVAEPATRRQ